MNSKAEGTGVGGWERVTEWPEPELTQGMGSGTATDISPRQREQGSLRPHPLASLLQGDSRQGT